MKKLHLPFLLLPVLLGACSSAPKAGYPDGRHSPETVEITYRVQPGREIELQSILDRAWIMYNQEHLVLPRSRAIVTTREYGNRPRIVETLTWTSHSALNHAPNSINELWNQIQNLCEPRAGHDGVEMIELKTGEFKK